MDDLGIEIRKQIAHYIDGDITADELEAWLTADTWEAEGPARELSLAAMGLVAEYTGDDQPDDDAELRERLGALSRTYWFDQAPRTVISDSESNLIRHGQLTAASERQHVAESA
jgi:hypothetical protein